MKYFLTIEVLTVDVSAYRPGYYRYVRVKGHIPTNKFALIWVVIGDQELPSVFTRGVIWHYS